MSTSRKKSTDAGVDPEVDATTDDAQGSASTKKTGKKSSAEDKAAARLEAHREELRRRTTPQAVKVGRDQNPRWFVPTMVGLMLAGLLWLVTTYLTGARYPLPSAGQWNIGIGFVLIMSGFLLTTRWK